jgi:hypothetical protein
MNSFLFAKILLNPKNKTDHGVFLPERKREHKAFFYRRERESAEDVED